MFRKNIFFFAFVLTLVPCSSTIKAADFHTDYATFYDAKLKDFRLQRADRARTCDISLAVEILDFVAQSKRKYGETLLGQSPETYELIIDVCDVINLQDDSFKSSYADNIEGIGFDFYAFDQLAKIMHRRDQLFGKTPVYFQHCMGQVIAYDLPLIYRVLRNIHDTQHNNFPIAPHPTEKAKNLRFICRVSGDYLSINRLEGEVDALLALTDFTRTETREAFLAQTIQAGELCKALSHRVRKTDCTIPWDEIGKIRDCIVHQDENGFDQVFVTILTPESASVNFLSWQNEFKLFKASLGVIRSRLWPNLHSDFEKWFEECSAGKSTYDSVTLPIDQATKDKFQNQNTNYKSERWENLLNGRVPAKFDEISQIRKLLKKLRGNDNLKRVYEDVEAHLWQTLKDYNLSLSGPARKAFVKLAQDNIDDETIITVAIASLRCDQSFLAEKIIEAFEKSMCSKGINHHPYTQSIEKIKPALPETRKVRALLTVDASKSLTQVQRKQFMMDTFTRVTELLHELSHDDAFHEEIVRETAVTPLQYSMLKEAQTNQRLAEYIMKVRAIIEQEQQGHLTHDQALQRIEEAPGNHNLEFDLLPPSQEMEEFATKHMIGFMKKAHIKKLPDDIKTKPTVHLAAVYHLSVGLSILKEYIKTYTASLPSYLIENCEKLKRERNYLAHGDDMRDVAGVESFQIHIKLLSEALYHLKVGIGRL